MSAIPIDQRSPHDILQAWQDGEISYRDAIDLTASRNLFELYEACRSSGVELRRGLTQREAANVDQFVADLLS